MARIRVVSLFCGCGGMDLGVINGSIMTMPGLPKKPAAFEIDVNEDGVITGLF